MKKYDFDGLSNYFFWQAVSNSNPSSQPKFSRRVIKPIRTCLYGLFARLLAKPVNQGSSCDVLLLHRSKKGRKLGLRKYLVQELRRQGLNVVEAHTEKNKAVLKKKLLSPPLIKIPLKYFFNACYASYIIDQFNPKVIMTDSNGSTLTTFLKAFLADKSKLVHVAHSVTTDNYRHYSLVEYDYYFLYGRSSLDKLQKRKVLFGNCNAVLTGPYLAHNGFSLKPGHANKNILLFGVNPNMEKKPHIQKMYVLIKNWLNQHNDYQLFVKMHPRSTLDFWNKAEKDFSNIQMIKKGVSMQEALSEISITLSIYTNAVLDAALLNKPSLMVSDNTINDEFDIEKFFLPRCKNEAELHKSIEKILVDYSYYLEKTTEFAKYHLEHQQDSVQFISNCVREIVHDKETFPVEPIKGTPFLLP